MGIHEERSYHYMNLKIKAMLPDLENGQTHTFAAPVDISSAHKKRSIVAIVMRHDSYFGVYPEKVETGAEEIYLDGCEDWRIARIHKALKKERGCE